MLKAQIQLKRNIDAMLAARGQTRADLARWCRRSDAWISKIYAVELRAFPAEYLDRIADFFGLATYQLFQPGISPLTERRGGRDRRRGQERRLSHLTGLLRPDVPPPPADLITLQRLKRLTPEDRELVEQTIDAALRRVRPGVAPRQAVADDRSAGAETPAQIVPRTQTSPRKKSRR